MLRQHATRSHSLWIMPLITSSAIVAVRVIMNQDPPRLQRPLRVLRSGWLLGTSFLEHTRWWDGSSSTRKLTWQKAVQSSPSYHSDNLQHYLVQLLSSLLLQPQDQEVKEVLISKGAINLLLDYIAFGQSSSPLLQRALESLENALEIFIEHGHIMGGTHISLIPLGILLQSLMDKSNHQIDMDRLGQQLLTILQYDEVKGGLRQFSHLKPRDDQSLLSATTAFLTLLSVESNQIQSFALWALDSIVCSLSSYPGCSSKIVASITPLLLTKTLPETLLTIPQENQELQQRAATLLSRLVAFSQEKAVVVPQEVYELWMKLARQWGQERAYQIEAAMILRSLSTRPCSRLCLIGSSETMEMSFRLARQLHQEKIQERMLKAKEVTEKMSDNSIMRRSRWQRWRPQTLFTVRHVPPPIERNPKDRLTVQNHLSSTIRNLCTSYQNAYDGLPMPHEGLDTKVPYLRSKRSLPMSKVFMNTHDVMDLPVYGAEEFEADTEFGWIDMLTQWTANRDKSIRENAIETLVHLAESKSDVEDETQLHILQAWLTSMLQHVRNLSGLEEILAVRQVEEIAQVTDEMTAGSEHIRFNSTVMEAGTSALAILAEQHYQELLEFGVVSLMALIQQTTKNMTAQCARVLANIAAANTQAITSSERENDYSRSVEESLSSFNSGKLFLLDLQDQQYTSNDPLTRSECYRAFANMHAYREAKHAHAGEEHNSLKQLSLPVYGEGVHPIIPQHPCGQEEWHKTDMDIVFVHGLRGHAFGTWRTDMNHGMESAKDVWPDILLRSDLEKHSWVHPRILTLGYDADMLRRSSPWPALTLEERANVLMRALAAAHIGTNRPVVFVTHSMGGLLVKKMLVQSAKRKFPLADYTKGVVFLAVPHFGSNLAQAIRSEAVRKLLQTHPALEDLSVMTPDDRRLESLNNSFQALHIDSLSLAEGKAAPLGIPRLDLSAMIVEPDSANPGYGSFYIILEHDHMTICKAKQRDDPMYQHVLKFIQQTIHKENTPYKEKEVNTMGEQLTEVIKGE